MIGMSICMITQTYLEYTVSTYRIKDSIFNARKIEKRTEMSRGANSTSSRILVGLGLVPFPQVAKVSRGNS